MANEISFPLYAYGKGDWSMFLVKDRETILSRVEPFDFENDGYLFWDAQGRSVRLTIERTKLTNIEQAKMRSPSGRPLHDTRRPWA